MSNRAPRGSSHKPHGLLKKKRLAMHLSASLGRPVSQTPTLLHTVASRFMGVRVSQRTREQQSKKAAKDKQNAKQAIDRALSFKETEVTSILPQRNDVDAAALKALKIKTKVTPIGLKNAIFTTSHVPTLSFDNDGMTLHGDDGDEIIISNEQYIAERRKQEEKLVWEHEMIKMSNLKKQLESTKKQEIQQAVILPGFDLTYKQQEKLRTKILADEEKKTSKATKPSKKGSKHQEFESLDTMDFDNNSYGYDFVDETDKSQENNDEDQEHANQTINNKKKIDSRVIEDRLSQKEQEIVNKVRSRAYQQGTTPFQYCKQNMLLDIIPLLHLKPFRDTASSIDTKKSKKRKHNDENSDDSFPQHQQNVDGDEDSYDLDALSDFDDNHNTEMDNSDDFEQNISRTKSPKKTQYSVPAIEMQHIEREITVYDHDQEQYRYSLQSFNQLHAKKSTGIRLNPKVFLPRNKTTSIDISNPENDGQLLSTTPAVTTDPSKVYVHRRRPNIPDSTFLELGVNPGIIGKLSTLHIRDPTAIQKLALPYLIRRYNQRTGKVYVPPTVAIQAYTGSGKTLSYTLPMLSIVDPNIASRIPPPNVIAAIRQLQGITSLPNPPPLQADPTPADEVERKIRIIQYSQDQMFNPDGSAVNGADDIKDKNAFFADSFAQEDIDENNVDTLLSTRQFIDKISNNIDIFNMTPEQWERHVFEQEQVENEQRTIKAKEQAEKDELYQTNNNTYSKPLPTQIDASMFNTRVYSLEAARLRKKNSIKQHLHQIFPFMSPDLLDPDLPHSTLQSIVVVPTKELALQIAKQITEANHTVWQSPHAISGGHQLLGDKKAFVVPHKGKSPINVRMVTGKVDPILLGSIGVFLHKNLDTAQKSENGENQSFANTKTPYNKKTGLNVATGKMVDNEAKYEQEQYSANARQHPFVEFGKNHKHYRPDQAEYRKELQEREKEQLLRVMRLRERQLQGEKLSQFEENEIILQDDKDSRKALKKRHEEDDGDSEQEFDDYTTQFPSKIGDNDHDESDDYIEFVDEGDNDYEDNPKKLLQLNDDELLAKYDSFRGNYFDSANKHFKKMSSEEQFELKTRIAQAITRQHTVDADKLRKKAEHEQKQSQLAMGMPVVVMRDETSSRRAKKQQQEEIKERYMKEVSDQLLNQIGGQHGDFVEVVREKQPHVIVGTPSTIVQLIKSGAIQLPSTGLSPNQLKSMVFDEVDHLARNEFSQEHTALLELLSLPADQSIFVSASMTRDSARLLTRLSRRQDQFINNKIPQRETVSNLLNLPRPPAHTFGDDITEEAYSEAFAFAQSKVDQFTETIDNNDRALQEIVLSSPRAKKDRVNALSNKLEDPKEKQQIVSKITDTLYKQNFVPIIPDEIYHRRLQQSIDRGKLSLTTTSDEYGEVLFLSTEDYRAEKVGEDGESRESGNEHALPIPPFIKQYYLTPPQINTETLKKEEQKMGKTFNRSTYIQHLKDKLALDMICQFKLRPLTLDKDDKRGQRLEFTQESQNAFALNGVNADDIPSRHSNKYEITANLEDDILSLSKKLQEQDNANGKSKNKKKKPNKLNTASEACPGTLLVFFNPRREEDMMNYYRQLTDTGLKVGIYCSKSNRHQKYQVLTKNSKLDVILANDTLSRGIDFKSLSMVINVDTPRSANTFIHRSGRVGRVGGMYRKAATVVNICDFQPTIDLSKQDLVDSTPEILVPKQSETSNLLKHAEKSGITINPWPFVVPYNLNRVYLRSLKTIISQETERHGIQRHLHRKAATEEYITRRNIKLHKMGIIQTKKTGLASGLPEGYGDSAFQQGGLGSGAKAMQGIAVSKLKSKMGNALRGENTKPWIQTGSSKGNKKGGSRSHEIKH